MPKNSCLIWMVRRLATLWCAVVVSSSFLASGPYSLAEETSEASPETADSQQEPEYRTELIRGTIDWLAPMLKSEFGISTVPEVAESTLAIKTDDGEVLPLVENLRGRAFRKDPRLRGKDMQILARRYEGHPLVQILRIYEFDQDERYEVDYWCDVCAIVMFETGPCACCQDHNRLRMRLVDSAGNELGEEKEVEPLPPPGDDADEAAASES